MSVGKIRFESRLLKTSRVHMFYILTAINKLE